MSNNVTTIENGLAPGETVNPHTGEIVGIDSPVMPTMSASDNEMTQQITTAKRYPRDLTTFRKTVRKNVTLTEAIAEECIYAVPRGGKTIEGPSVRFAEVVQSAWGNCRVGGRIVGDDGKFITAQGAFHDLESNSLVIMETRRRITDSKGKRYNDDMIGVTGQAAIAIASRNAVLKGIPKAFWADLYEDARKVVAGDFQTLANRRAKAMQAFAIYGIVPEQLFANLGIKGEDDMTPDHLVTLRGILNALKDGTTTPEEAFPRGDAASPPPPAKRPEKDDTTVKTETKKKPPAKKAADGPKDPPPQAEGAKGDAPSREAETGAKTEPGTSSPESTPDEPFDDSPGSVLDGYLKGLAGARSVDEVAGMRAVAKNELSKRELAVWQGAALAREQLLRKG